MTANDGARPRRVSIVGNSGSGKSTLGRRVAKSLGVPFHELDAEFHQPGWVQRPDGEFREVVEQLAADDAWVIDGNYPSVVVDGPVWRRADTVVWLDLSRRRVMWQVTRRTVRRVLTRQQLWNGNREPLRNLFERDPAKGILAWAWTQHAEYEQRYLAAMHDPVYGHLQFVRLRNSQEATGWVDSLRHDVAGRSHVTGCGATDGTMGA